MYDMYPFHQNILLRPHFPNYCITFCAIKIKELRNAILFFSTYVHDLTLSRKFASKLFSQFWQKKIWKETAVRNVQKKKQIKQE